MQFFTKLTTSKISAFFYSWKNILISAIILALILVMETINFSLRNLHEPYITNVFVIINGLFVTSFTVFITTIYFKDDFKNKKISLERRYGVSTAKIFWSRVLTCLTLILIFLGFIIVYNLIFMTVTNDWKSFIKYRIFISSLGWYTILALMSFAITLFFMTFLKSALSITLIFLLSFGMIGGIVVAPYKIPGRIYENEQKKDKEVYLSIPRAYKLSNLYSDRLLLEALGENLDADKLSRWDEFNNRIIHTINIQTIFYSEKNLAQQQWTIPLNTNHQPIQDHLETKEGVIFEIPKAEDYLAFGLDIFSYILNHPEPMEPDDWNRPFPPYSRTLQQDYVERLYNNFPEITAFYKYFNDLFDHDFNLKNGDIYQQLDYLEEVVEPKYQPLIKYLRTQIILADKNDGYDGTLSFRAYYNGIDNFCNLDLEGFNFSKVNFFRALNASFNNTFKTRDGHDYHFSEKVISDDERNYRAQKLYDGYYKRLKTELIVNPTLHLATLFHSTTYNNPILDNLDFSDPLPLNNIGNYYVDYRIASSLAPYGTTAYFENIKKAKFHQLIHPEVYFVIYALINFGIIGINYALFRSRIKRNKF